MTELQSRVLIYLRERYVGRTEQEIRQDISIGGITLASLVKRSLIRFEGCIYSITAAGIEALKEGEWKS
jgi:hypothetical protein